MGFVSPSANKVEDEDAMLVDDLEVDEDGMQIESDIDLGAAIEEFLNSCVDKKFLAKMERETAGKQKWFLKMNIESIKPHVKPSK